MSPNSVPDLTTYEGRRALWAAEMLSGKYQPYLGGGLEARVTIPGRAVEAIAGPPQQCSCCCLGVACHVVMEQTPRLIAVRDPSVGHSREFYALENFDDFSTGFLPIAAAAWFGLDTRPYARLDRQAVDELNVENDRREQAREDRIFINALPLGPDGTIIEVGDQVPLHSLNDAGCPWPIIAGLIVREHIIGAKTGPVDA